MKNLTPEMIEKAKAAKSAEELLEVAKANGVEMTADEAATYFAQLNPQSGELDDDDLDAVAGGGCGASEEASAPVAKNGDTVQMTNGATCKRCGSAVGKYIANSNTYVYIVKCVHDGEVIATAPKSHDYTIL